jgi:phospholipid/cholesterol/gamma-HCH transport system substrate-binding protein
MAKSMKVGAFVLFGLILCGIATFMIGENRQLWDKKIIYNAAFEDVAGLKPGAPIRMGGVDIGTVTRVGHAPDVGDRRIYVTLAVVSSESGRVRTDTRAQIQNKGLLGDKMVELSSGGKGLPLEANGTVQVDEPVDFTSKLSTIANKADAVVGNVEQATKAIADPKFRDDLQATVSGLRVIVDGIAHTDSAAHRFLLDPNEGQKLDRVLSNLDVSTAHLNAILADAHDVTTQVKTGPGIAHAVLYDGEMSSHAAGALAEVHRDLETIRTGNGLIHGLLYGDMDSQHVMTNVNAMSDDLRAIVHGMRQGKGTIGGLLVDPSVYEDIKGLVGNIERNDVLRALVRYSIKADEKNPAVPRVDVPAEVKASARKE